MATLNGIRDALNAYDPRSIIQCDVKATLSIHVSADPQPDPDVCISNLREDLPPEVLYAKEMLRGPTVLYRLIRDYLVVKGLAYTPHPTSNRISHGLVNMIYVDNTDRILANQSLISPPPGSTQGSQQSFPQTNEAPNSKIAHNISSRFKKDDRYTGKIGEDIQEAINNYRDCAEDFHLGDEQMLRFFHNIFDGEAKRFYRSHVIQRATDFNSAASLMVKEFNSLTRQNRVRKLLQNLRLSRIIDTKRIPVSEALEELRETITKYTPQGPPTHQSEQDKTEYLHDAVIGVEWAKSVLTQSLAAIPPWTFQQLYTALDAAWLQEQKQKEGIRRDRTDVHRSQPMPPIPGIHFQRQNTYGIPRRPGSTSSNPRMQYPPRNPTHNQSMNGADRFGKIRACHNCGSKYHLIRDCPKPLALRKNVSQMLQTRPAKRILYELCEQAEHALGAFEIDFTAFEEEPEPEPDPREEILMDDITLDNDDELADQAVTHHQVVEHTPHKHPILSDYVENLNPMDF